MKTRTAEMHEGPQAFERFQGAMKRVLSVSHDEIQRRIAEQRKLAAQNPNRRGPRRKVKPSVSSDHVAIGD